MTFTRASIPDQHGRVAVVTGANGGLGLETAKALAGAGAHVVMAVRNRTKAADAMREIRAETPDADLELVTLDLATLDSVREAAATILTGHGAVDVLVNNAGVMAIPESTTTDGFETQLGVNHLGHWALTALLMPALLAAPAARVVSVTSTARHMGRRLDPTNPHLHGTYSPWTAYGQSKLANHHFALGLQREFERAGVAAQSLMAHPGLSNTDLSQTTLSSGGGGRLAPLLPTMVSRAGMTPADGALPQLRAATDPKARGGELYAPRWGGSGPAVRRPVIRPGADGAIETLWIVSERETGIPMTVGVPAL